MQRPPYQLAEALLEATSSTAISIDDSVPGGNIIVSRAPSGMVSLTQRPRNRWWTCNSYLSMLSLSLLTMQINMPPLAEERIWLPIEVYRAQGGTNDRV